MKKQKLLSPKIIGKRIKNLRHKHNMSQTTAASVFNVSVSTYIKWENGQRNISDEHKVILANKYGTTVNQLFFEDGFIYE